MTDVVWDAEDFSTVWACWKSTKMCQWETVQICKAPLKACGQKFCTISDNTDRKSNKKMKCNQSFGEQAFLYLTPKATLRFFQLLPFQAKDTSWPSFSPQFLMSAWLKTCKYAKCWGIQWAFNELVFTEFLNIFVNLATSLQLGKTKTERKSWRTLFFWMERYQESWKSNPKVS